MNEEESPPPLDLRWRVALGIYIVVNLALVLTVRIGPGVPGDPASMHPDWDLWSSLPAAIARGEMYSSRSEVPFAWSPVAGWLMSLVPSVGYWPWLAIHVAAVFLLRDRLLIVLTLASWGFWVDAAGGNVFVFVFVAGAIALRGNRTAAIIYLTLFILMPRPIQVPLGLWLLWRLPEIRLPAVALLAVHSIVVLLSGYAADWIHNMLIHVVPVSGNIGPSVLLGLAWLALGVPLGAWLLLQGRFGWAGLAWSSYWLHSYLLMPLLDLRPTASAWSRDPRPLEERGLEER